MLITALFIKAKKRKANYIFNNKEVEMLCSHLKYCRRIFQGLQGLSQLAINFKRHGLPWWRSG